MIIFIHTNAVCIMMKKQGNSGSYRLDPWRPFHTSSSVALMLNVNEVAMLTFSQHLCVRVVARPDFHIWNTLKAGTHHELRGWSQAVCCPYWFLQSPDFTPSFFVSFWISWLSLAPFIVAGVLPKHHLHTTSLFVNLSIDIEQDAQKRQTRLNKGCWNTVFSQCLLEKWRSWFLLSNSSVTIESMAMSNACSTFIFSKGRFVFKQSPVPKPNAFLDRTKQVLYFSLPATAGTVCQPEFTEQWFLTLHFVETWTKL